MECIPPIRTHDVAGLEVPEVGFDVLWHGHPRLGRGEEGGEEVDAMIGGLYFMLPGIVISLVVGCAVAVSYRTRRTYVVALLWLAIILLAALIGRGLPKMWLP